MRQLLPGGSARVIWLGLPEEGGNEALVVQSVGVFVRGAFHGGSWIISHFQQIVFLRNRTKNVRHLLDGGRAGVDARPCGQYRAS